jgi:Beta-lactamase enzyme family
VHGRSRSFRRKPAPWLAAVLVTAGVGVIVAGSLAIAGHGERAALTARVATAGPRAQTVATPPDPLGAAAASYIATRRGVVSATVYDLTSGKSWTVGRSAQAQDEASIVKLDILEALLARHRDGLPAADRPLAQQMIEDSDNDAATALWDAAGAASGIRAFNNAAGLTHTVPSACVLCAGFPWPGWGLTTTVPPDQIALLRLLVQPNALISSVDRNAALRLMENVTAEQRWGVSGGVPARVRIALKNGWLPLNDADTDWQINSVGWISGQGRNYLIAVLTTGNPTETYGIGTIDKLSAMVWRTLG